MTMCPPAARIASPAVTVPPTEQPEAVDRRVELIEAMDLSKAPGGMNLIAVRQGDELRASGRAAGVKERAYRVTVRGQRKIQGAALRRQAFIEANNLAT